MQDEDLVIERQWGGCYNIRRWLDASSKAVLIEGHRGMYDLTEVCRRLHALRPHGYIYLRDGVELHVIQP